MIEVAGLKKKFKLTKDHKKNNTDNIDPREDKQFFHSVRDVSFHCNKGRCWVLGPNGAVKQQHLE